MRHVMRRVTGGTGPADRYRASRDRGGSRPIGVSLHFLGYLPAASQRVHQTTSPAHAAMTRRALVRFRPVSSRELASATVATVV